MGRRQGERPHGVRFPPPREVSRGGLLSPLAVHQKKGAGKEEDKLAEGLGRVAGGSQLDIAERSRGAEGSSAGPSGGRGTLRASVKYFIYIFF